MNSARRASVFFSFVISVLVFAAEHGVAQEEIRRVAGRIDDLVAEAWQKNDVVPADAADAADAAAGRVGSPKAN